MPAKYSARRESRDEPPPGDVWKFGFLDRAEKILTEDLNTYGVPTVVEEVIAILVGVLTG